MRRDELLKRIAGILQVAAETYQDIAEVQSKLDAGVRRVEASLQADESRYDLLVEIVRDLAPHLEDEERKELLACAHELLRDSGAFLDALNAHEP